jgi:hypothetical protein
MRFTSTLVRSRLILHRPWALWRVARFFRLHRLGLGEGLLDIFVGQGQLLRCKPRHALALGVLIGCNFDGAKFHAERHLGQNHTVLEEFEYAALLGASPKKQQGVN